MLSVTGIFYFYADMINLTTKIILLIMPVLVASILVTDALLVDSRATDSHTVSTDTPVTPVTDEVRVVSFSPEISEIIAYLGGIDSLAATDINSTYPDELKKLPKIADYYSVNQEALSALNFDHILLSRDFNALIISKLTKYQNKLHIYSITDGSDLLKVIEDLGKILHREKQASDIINDIQMKIQNLREEHANKHVIKTAIVIWDKPLLTAGGETFLNQAVKICGGSNIFEKLTIKFPSVSAEKLIAGKPDVVISLIDDNQNLPSSLKNRTVVLTREQQDSLMKISPRSYETGIPAVCQAIDSARNLVHDKTQTAD